MSTLGIKTQIRYYFRDFHEVPSIRALCQLLGKKDSYRTQMKRVLDKLVNEGFLSQNDTGRYLPGEEFFSYPLHHSVQAGHLTMAGDLVTTINLYRLLLHDTENTIMITINGDSMQDAGIHDGDIAVVNTKKRFKPADIVVARVGNEFTVKYYRSDKRGPYLEPANQKYKNIYFKEGEEVNIIGVVTRVIKSFSPD